MDQTMVENLTAIVGAAHRTLDGIFAGDLPSIFLGVGFILVAAGWAWMSVRGTKLAAKCAYIGLKWAVTSPPDSEICRDLLCAIGDGATAELSDSGHIMRVQHILCRISSFGKVEGVECGPLTIDDLPKRERKKILRSADEVYQRLVRERDEMKKKRALMQAKELLDETLGRDIKTKEVHYKCEGGGTPSVRGNVLISSAFVNTATEDAEEMSPEKNMKVIKECDPSYVPGKNKTEKNTTDPKVKPVECSCASCREAKRSKSNSEV